MAEQASLSERLRHELREYAIVSLYLYVCFAVLLLYKSALLETEGIHYVPFGLAAGKALILGKFVLLGEATGVGTRTGARNLRSLIVHKVSLLLVVLILLTLVEELIVGWIHGNSIAQLVTELKGKSLLEMTATCLLVLLVLIPYVATQEISKALGPGVLRGVLLGDSPGNSRVES